LINEKKDFKETETEFLKRIKPSLGPEYFEKYKSDILKNSKYNAYLPYIDWIGGLYIRVLLMIIVPLVVASLISGLSGIGSGQNLLRLGIKTVLYYFSTSTIAIFVGIFFVYIFSPGSGVDVNSVQEVGTLANPVSFKDSLLNIIPVNIFEAFARANLISIIFFSLLFGFFVTKVNDRSRILISNFFSAVFEILIQLTNFIIRFLPIGLMSLSAAFVADYSGDLPKLLSLLSSLGKYFITLTFALSFHAVITLPLLLYFGFRANPWKHFKNMRSALITSCFTASSVTALPLTMYSVNKNCGVSNKVTSFILPLGASISMDGTALYTIVTVFFIAQAYGIDLSFVETFIIVATTLLASIGSSGVPLSGLLILSVVLAAVGLPVEGIGLLLIIDRILEMFRTMVNVWSDSCGAVIVAKSEGEELRV
jgi:Na+/H+-dicarboxylate symporter